MPVGEKVLEAKRHAHRRVTGPKRPPRPHDGPEAMRQEMAALLKWTWCHLAGLACEWILQNKKKKTSRTREIALQRELNTLAMSKNQTCQRRALYQLHFHVTIEIDVRQLKKITIYRSKQIFYIKCL